MTLSTGDAETGDAGMIAILSGTSHELGKAGNIEILAGASSGDQVDGSTVYFHGGTSQGRQGAGGNVEVRLSKSAVYTP